MRSPSSITLPEEDNNTLTNAITDTVSAERRVDPTDLEPLYAVINMDALQKLFREGANGRVEFGYEGCDVEVTVGETVTVRVTRERSVPRE